MELLNFKHQFIFIFLMAIFCIVYVAIKNKQTDKSVWTYVAILWNKLSKLKAGNRLQKTLDQKDQAADRKAPEDNKTKDKGPERQEENFHPQPADGNRRSYRRYHHRRRARGRDNSIDDNTEKSVQTRAKPNKKHRHDECNKHDKNYRQKGGRKSETENRKAATQSATEQVTKTANKKKKYRAKKVHGEPAIKA